MFAISNLINAIAMVLSLVLTLYMYVLIARSILSWVNPDPSNPIVRMLYSFTEPVLYPIRKRVPYLGGLDLSPLILILAILFLKFFLVQTLQDLALTLVSTGGGGGGHGF